MKTHLSERKRKIVHAYDTYLAKKGNDRAPDLQLMVDGRAAAYFTNMVPRYVFQAEDRKNKFFPDIPPLYEQKFDIDSSDLQNRVEIWIAGNKSYSCYNGVSRRVAEDPVGNKLYVLASGIKPRFCLMYCEDVRMAKSLLQKMEERTMTESEYNNIAEFTPRQLLWQWKQERRSK